MGYWIKIGGTRFPVPDGAVTIGRDHECDIVVTNDLASREHCRLRNSMGRLDIVDLNSSNGTTINSERLTGPRRLRGGDVIGIGTDLLEVVESTARRRQSATVRNAPELPEAADDSAHTGRRQVDVDFVEAFVASAATMTGHPSTVAAQARGFVDIILASARAGDLELMRVDTARLAAVAERIAEWTDTDEIEEWRGGVLAALCAIPTTPR